MGLFRNHSFPCFSFSRGFGGEILSLIPWSWGYASGLRPYNTNSVGTGQNWEDPTSTPGALYGQSPRIAWVLQATVRQGISQARQQPKVVRLSEMCPFRTLGSSVHGNQLEWQSAPGAPYSDQ